LYVSPDSSLAQQIYYYYDINSTMGGNIMEGYIPTCINN
jgi:hypothetical protein